MIYLGKIYPSTPEVNLSSVSFCLGEKVTLKKITSRYLQVDRIKFYAVQTWFWLANRKQHARKSHRSKRNGSPSLLFFTLLQASKAITNQVIFLQRLITRRTQRRRQAALFHVFTSVALQERWPSLSASRRFFQALRCFEHGPERTFGLQGKHSILFARLLLLLNSSFLSSPKSDKGLALRCF